MQIFILRSHTSSRFKLVEFFIDEDSLTNDTIIIRWTFVNMTTLKNRFNLAAVVALETTGQWIIASNRMTPTEELVCRCIDMIPSLNIKPNTWVYFRNEKHGFVQLHKTASLNEDDFISKIERPQMFRYPENKNKDTFDYIQITLCTISHNPSQIKHYFEAHKNQIIKMAFERLKNYRFFARYGIPISFLKITYVVFRNDSTIQITLELKKI